VKKYRKRKLKAPLEADSKTIIGMIYYNVLSEDLDGFHEVIRPGAFSKSLRGSDRIVSLWNHDASKPLGSTSSGTLKLTDSREGLKIRIYPPLHTTYGANALSSVERGDVDGFSFGFTIPPGGDRWLHKETGTVRELLDVKLIEVSLTVFPAYAAGTCAMARAATARDYWCKYFEREAEKTFAYFRKYLERKNEETFAYWRKELEAEETFAYWRGKLLRTSFKVAGSRSN
jgi:HK97 family phage prohead protease